MGNCSRKKYDEIIAQLNVSSGEAHNKSLYITGLDIYSHWLFMFIQFVNVASPCSSGSNSSTEAFLYIWYEI